LAACPHHVCPVADRHFLCPECALEAEVVGGHHQRQVAVDFETVHRFAAFGASVGDSLCWHGSPSFWTLWSCQGFVSPDLRRTVLTANRPVISRQELGFDPATFARESCLFGSSDKLVVELPGEHLAETPV